MIGFCLRLGLVLLAVAGPLRASEFVPPGGGRIYHSVYPGGRSGTEDDLRLSDVTAYERLAGRQVAWVYFSNNWYRSREFPARMARWIRGHGSIPFIRLMLRSAPDNPTPDPVFTLQAILDGKFDRDLARWARGARRFGSPLLVEYGTECNGEWFAWNGRWNGRARGPALFAAVFRHIVDVMRAEGADNIQWVFHINAESWPRNAWNEAANYYPGDRYVDFVGISAYGAQTPQDNFARRFRAMIDPAYREVRRFAPGKPVAILEFGCTSGSPAVDQKEWAEDALGDILSRRWPKIFAFSWWNERWQNDNNPRHDTTMRLQDNPELARVFREALRAHRGKIVSRPVYRR